MLENLILWLLIGGAAFYAGRNLYRILTGKTRGCTCEKGCGPPGLQQDIPDLKQPPKDRDH